MVYFIYIKLGECGKSQDTFIPPVQECEDSLLSMLNETAVFWYYWYPRMVESCDDTGMECFDSCRELFGEVFDY